MKTVHILFTCDIGGIEVLCRDYAKYSKNENLFLIIKGKGVIAKEIKELGGNVVELEAEKVGTLSAFRAAIKICTEDDVVCIVTHHEAPISNVIMGISKMLKPQIMTISYAHSAAEDMLIKGWGLKAAISNTIMKCSIRFADKVIAISEFVKRSVIKNFGISDHKINVIYNGTDLALNSININSEQVNRKNIIYVGRLIQEKGIQNTLKALSELDKSKEYNFTIVGDGPYKKELEKLTENYQLLGKVKFLGSRRDIKELLANSGIFIHMPDWEEGFGITVVEAMASGVVCVCADKGALPEILDNGHYGYIVKNIAELTFVLNRILDDTDESKKEYFTKRRLAWERAKDFSVEIFAAKLDQVTR